MVLAECLQTSEQPAILPNCGYDGDGLRVAKKSGAASDCTGGTVVKLYWRSLAGDALAESDGSGSTTNSASNEYVLFAGRRVGSRNGAGAIFYWFADQLGSTRSITTGNGPGQTSGQLCYDADFTPYGQEIQHSEHLQTGTCPPNYRFTGYEYDIETGLDYAFARYYSPNLGRFSSTDPLGGSIGNLQSHNAYAYVANNPMNLTDPMGLDYIDCITEANEMHCGSVMTWSDLITVISGTKGAFTLGNLFSGKIYQVRNSTTYLIGYYYYYEPLPNGGGSGSGNGNGSGGSTRGGGAGGGNTTSAPEGCPSRLKQAVNAATIASNEQLTAATVQALVLAELTGRAVIVGVAANGSKGLWENLGVSGGVSAGLAADPQGNVAMVFGVKGGGGFAGTGYTAGGAVTLSRKRTVFGLGGPATLQGAGGGGGLGMGASIAVSLTGSVTVTAGAATGVFGTFGGVSKNWVVPLVCP